MMIIDALTFYDETSHGPVAIEAEFRADEAWIAVRQTEDTMNAYKSLVRFCNEHPSLRPLLSISLVNGMVIPHVEAALQISPPVAIYIQPQRDRVAVSDRRWRDLWQWASTQGVPVIVATGYPWYSEPSQLVSVADKYPNLRVVMTNGGQFNISGLGQFNAYAALTRPNVFALTTGVYRQDFLEEVATNIGPHKLLFGSGSPDFHFPLEIRRVLWANLGDGDKARIVGSNAQGLIS